MWKQERNNKVRFFEDYLDPRTGNRKTFSVTMDKDTSRTRKEAKRKLDIRAALFLSRPLPSMTFKDLCDIYLEDKKQEVKDETFRQQSYDTQSYALTSLTKIIGAKTELSKLSPETISNAINAKSSAKVVTRNDRVRYARILIRYAKKKGFIDNDFSLSIPYIKASEEEKFSFDPASRFLEPGEIQELLSELDGANRDLTEFLLLSGCRIGEALSLSEEHIDFQSDDCHIVSTYVINGKRTGNPKRPASKRTIFMQPQLKSLLYHVISRNQSVRYMIGAPGTLVFVDENTAIPIYYQTYLKELKAAADRAGIDKKVTPHMLRRTHATTLYGAGIDKDDIAERLGHKPGGEDKITMECYIYINKQREKKVREAIRNIEIV